MEENVVNGSEKKIMSVAAWQALPRPRRVVFTNGCFDILHAGHVAYLEAARALGDHLVVGLNDDASIRRLKGAQRPINEVACRARVLAALACVDAVIVFAEDTPERLIAEVVPDVLVKGGDWPVERIVGRETVLARGGEVRTIPLVPGQGTTDIIARILDRYELRGSDA
jgi:rfaE bifunctional protein nucleotidyltransferase chain/domain